MCLLAAFFRKCCRNNFSSETLSKNGANEICSTQQSLQPVNIESKTTEREEEVTQVSKDGKASKKKENGTRASVRSRKRKTQHTMRTEMVNFVSGKKTTLDKEDARRTLKEICSEGEPKEFYQIMSKIGEGMFGNVYFARKEATNENFAMKQCSPSHVDCALSFYLNETIVLKYFTHPNVIKCHEFYFATPLEADSQPELKNVRVPFLIMELMVGSLGELLDFVYPTNSLEEEVIAFVMREVLQGVAFLHRKGVFHRDLKSDNVLLSLEGHVKVADFGLSSRFACPEEEFHGMTGTTLWMAPEVCRIEKAVEAKGLEKPRKSTYTYKADIWSLGIILIELIDGQPPFMEIYRKNQNSEIKKKIIRDPASRSKREVSISMTSLMEKMLCKDPNERKDCKLLLKNKIFDNVVDQEILARYVRLMIAFNEKENQL